jgi:hypothetical protein
LLIQEANGVAVDIEIQQAERQRHFLHVGKTGGSAVKAALASCAGQHRIVLHGHATTLRDVPDGEHVFFFLRHPITRFVSGFYSRRRRGAPLYDYKWSRRERAAFTKFETANELAEGLYSRNPIRRMAAAAAMRGIGHVRSSFYDWLESDKYLAARSADILLIGFQETLADDYARLLDLLGIDGIPLPTGIDAHRNPENLDRDLSPLATANLQRWYARDIALYDRLFARRADP